MNQNLILRIVGVILCIEALCMIPPLLLSVFGGGVDQRAFLYALLICGGVGVLLSLIRADNARLQTRDGFVCVALCWIALSVFGALPYFFSGSCSFIDAIFETVSGLTTTGASIFPSPASLPQGIQFWRALTQWMGGMGILVLMLALLPKLSEGSVNLMKAESPGPISTKLRPRTGETARILYRIYIALTVAEALLLRIAGLPLFDAITTALTTISTGGFSIRDASIAYYQSHLVNWILIFFMFAASVNFTLLYLCVTRRFREALKSEELRVYSLVVVGASAMIAADLIVRTGRDIGSAIENAAFQVTTLISTTGYCTEDFDLWPQFCRCILVLVMFFGGCAGSTSGGAKIDRFIVLWKNSTNELERCIRPNHILSVQWNGKAVSHDLLNKVLVFITLYTGVIVAGALVLSATGVPLTDAFFAAMACVSNAGCELNMAGYGESYILIPDFGKWVLSFLMVTGRLEIFTVLVLFIPGFWRK